MSIHETRSFSLEPSPHLLIKEKQENREQIVATLMAIARTLRARFPTDVLFNIDYKPATCRMHLDVAGNGAAEELLAFIDSEDLGIVWPRRSPSLPPQ